MYIRNITRHWAIASAVAAMLAASTSGTFAQTPDATAPASPATPDATAPMTPAAPMTPDATTPPMTPPMAAPMTSAGPTDYKILSNRVFDYVNLQQAKAHGLSDREIASTVKIAKLTGLSFDQVLGAVDRGETFPALATEYGIKLGDVYDVDKEMQDISDYTTLYESAIALNNTSGSVPPLSSGSSFGTATPSPMTPAPMTPDATAPGMSSSTTLDIVDTAMAAKNLTTLVKALQVAGLVETLKGAGPFTVFAPDDKAFSKLPAGALDALLADPAKLKTVLTYHVIPASIKASDALAMTSPTSRPTVEGETLQVTKGRRGRLKVNDATVIKADIEASNGVIHIIDKVLMPPMDTMTPAAPAPMDNTAPAPPTMPAPATPDTTTPPAAPPTTPDTTPPPAVPPTTPAPAQ